MVHVMEHTEHTCDFCGKGMCWYLALQRMRKDYRLRSIGLASQHQSPVVQTLDSAMTAIHRIKIHPVDNAIIGFSDTYRWIVIYLQL